MIRPYYRVFTDKNVKIKGRLRRNRLLAEITYLSIINPSALRTIVRAFSMKYLALGRPILRCCPGHP